MATPPGLGHEGGGEEMPNLNQVGALGESKAALTMQEALHSMPVLFEPPIVIISPEDEEAITELLFVDEKYQHVVTLLESFHPGDDGIAFNGKLRELERILISTCQNDENELDMAFASLGSAALKSDELARQLAKVGAALSRLQSKNGLTLRTALLNLFQAIFMKVDLMERCAPAALINATNLMGEYLLETRTSLASSTLLAKPLTRYLTALLATGGSLAHKTIATQLMMNGRDMWPVAKNELEDLSVKIKKITITKPPHEFWLFFASDLFLVNFMSLPKCLEAFYISQLEQTSKQGSSTEQENNIMILENKDTSSQNSGVSSDPPKKLRPILGMGARSQNSEVDNNQIQMTDFVNINNNGIAGNSSNYTSANQMYNSTEHNYLNTKLECLKPINDIPTVVQDLSKPPPNFLMRNHECLNVPLPDEDSTDLEDFTDPPDNANCEQDFTNVPDYANPQQNFTNAPNYGNYRQDLSNTTHYANPQQDFTNLPDYRNCERNFANPPVYASTQQDFTNSSDYGTYQEDFTNAPNYANPQLDFTNLSDYANPQQEFTNPPDYDNYQQDCTNTTDYANVQEDFTNPPSYANYQQDCTNTTDYANVQQDYTNNIQHAWPLLNYKMNPQVETDDVSDNNVGLDDISLDRNDQRVTSQMAASASEDTTSSQVAKRLTPNLWRQQAANTGRSEDVHNIPHETTTETTNWRQRPQLISSDNSNRYDQAARDNVLHQDGVRMQAKRENVPRRDEVPQRQHDNKSRHSDERRQQGEEYNRQKDTYRRKSSDNKRQQVVVRSITLGPLSQSVEITRHEGNRVTVAAEGVRRHLEMNRRQDAGTRRSEDRQRQGRDLRRSDVDTHGRWRHVGEPSAEDGDWRSSASRNENPEARGNRNHTASSQRDNNARQSPRDVPRAGKYWLHDDRCDRQYE